LRRASSSSMTDKIASALLGVVVIPKLPAGVQARNRLVKLRRERRHAAGSEQQRQAARRASRWSARVQPALSRSDTQCNWHLRPLVTFDALVTASLYSYYRIPFRQSRTNTNRSGKMPRYQVTRRKRMSPDATHCGLNCLSRQKLSSWYISKAAMLPDLLEVLRAADSFLLFAATTRLPR